MHRIAGAVPPRVSEETEKRLQLGVLLVLTGQLPASHASSRAVAEYMRKCRESSVRLGRAA
jgi:hypothetical protein